MMHDITFPTFEALARNLNAFAPPHLRAEPTPSVWRSVRLSPYPTVRLSTGATVRFRTAEDPDKLRGPNLTGVWLDEASLMSEEAYKVAIACLREKGEQGWLSATFTPRGFGHWTYKVFGQAAPDTDIYHATTRENPFNPPDFAHKLSQQYGTGLRAAQELDGRFVSLEGAEWPPEYFADDLWFDQWPADAVVCRAMALDPSKGKDATVADPKSKVDAKREPDDSAWVWGCVDRRGVVWLDADLDNARDATKIIADGIGHYRRFAPQAVLIEINLFQSMLGGEWRRQCAALNLGPTPLYGVTNTEDKCVRIRATVGPHLAQRLLRFRRTPGCRRLVQQLRDWPAGTKDDGPDALDMLLRVMLYLVRGRGAVPGGRGQPHLLGGG